MLRTCWYATLLFCLMLAASACGGAGSAVPDTPSTPRPTPTPTPTPGATATPTPAPTGTPLPPTSSNGVLALQLSGWFSSTAKSVLVTLNGSPFPVATIPPYCSSTCTIWEPAPAGSNVPLNIKTYASADASETPLAIANASPTIFNGQTTTVNAVLTPVMNSWSVSLVPATVQEGMANHVTVKINAFDVSGTAITATYVDPNGISPTFSASLADPTNQTTLQAAPGDNVPGGIEYSGSGGGPATVSVTQGAISRSETLGYSAPAAGTIEFSTFDGEFLNEWGAPSVNPIRKYVFTNSGAPIAVAFDGNGTVWTSAGGGIAGYRQDSTYAGYIRFPSGDKLLTFDRSGNLYSAVPANGVWNVLNEYHVNADLSLTLVRTITAPSADINSAAVAPDGTIYIGMTANYTAGNSQSAVYEYSAGSGSGAVAPVAANSYVGQVAVDGTGNVYAVVNPQYEPTAQIYKWTAGSFGANSGAIVFSGTASMQYFSVAPDGHGCGALYATSAIAFSWGSGYCPPADQMALRMAAAL